MTNSMKSQGFELALRSCKRPTDRVGTLPFHLIASPPLRLVSSCARSLVIIPHTRCSSMRKTKWPGHSNCNARVVIGVVVMVFASRFFNVLLSGILCGWQESAKVTSEAMIRSGHYFKESEEDEYLGVTPERKKERKGWELATKYLCDLMFM